MFRTFEISEPRFEHEGLRLVTVKSGALRGRADLSLWVPPAGVNPAGVVILLHGVYGSHWGWSLRGGAHRTAARLVAEGSLPPFVLAMPSDGLWGDGSGYLRHATQDFERWIVEDVPAAVRQAVPALAAKAPLFLAGLSMGGFGALRLGAKYGDRFRAVCGHSSITEFGQLAQFVEEPLGTYGCAPEDASVLETVRARRGALPALRFDCGTEDPLIEPNRVLHRELQSLGVPHEYEEHPGGHEWPYWERHLADTLRFFGRCAAGSAGR
jgi:enterochelin esterase-like enzyme